MLLKGNSNLFNNNQKLKGAFGQLGSSILILGDGNLSFSAALARLFPNKWIVATVLEDEDEFYAKFCSSIYNLQFLYKRCPNVAVKFGVNAITIRSRAELTTTAYFTDIIMNFPHHGTKTNLKKSRILLKQMLRCASCVLMDEGVTRFHITFARNQSGLFPPDVINQTYFVNKQLPRHNDDSWKAIYVAAEVGLRVDMVGIFQPHLFPGYQCSGYLNRDQSFHVEDLSETLTFVKAYNFVPGIRLRIGSAKFMENANVLFRGFRFQVVCAMLFLFNRFFVSGYSKIFACVSYVSPSLQARHFHYLFAGPQELGYSRGDALQPDSRDCRLVYCGHQRSAGVANYA